MPAYSALRESAAWLDVSARGKIRVLGEDRQGFLHAISTQAIEDLPPGQGVYAYFLNVQGRIQTDAYLWVFPSHVLIETEPETAQGLVRHLEKYIIMDDVVLEDTTAALAALALEGPGAEEIATRLFRDPPLENHAHREVDGVTILRASLTGEPGFRFLTEAGRAKALAEKLAKAGAVEAAAADFRTVRVENQVPRFGEDFFDTTIPHETQRLDAVSFTKGCYLGQEIVERVRSRGQVNRLLAGVEVETDTAPPGGSVILFKDREAGRLTSPVFSPRLGRVAGFGLLRREAADPGAAIIVEGQPGRVRERDKV